MPISDEVLASFAEKNVLITGGSGMIGRQVADILAGAGARIRIVSLDNIKPNENCEYLFGDLTDFNFCKEVSRDMDFVFHLAGVGASVRAARRLATHLVPMLMMNTNMLEAARLNKAKKVLFTSTVGTYAEAEVFVESEYRMDSEPLDFASWAKRMAEAQIYAYSSEYGLDNFSIIRPPNVYGPGDNFNPQNSLVIPSLMYRVYHKEDPLVVWGDGSAVRDFVYSRDVAEGAILALYYGTSPEFVNIGSGRAYTIKELVEALGSFLKFNYVFDPSKPAGVKRRVMDISLAKERIHYRPATGLKQGLMKTWEWFVSHPDEHLQKKNYFTAEGSENL